MARAVLGSRVNDGGEEEPLLRLDGCAEAGVHAGRGEGDATDRWVACACWGLVAVTVLMQVVSFSNCYAPQPVLS